MKQKKKSSFLLTPAEKERGRNKQKEESHFLPIVSPLHWLISSSKVLRNPLSVPHTLNEKYLKNSVNSGTASSHTNSCQICVTFTHLSLQESPVPARKCRVSSSICSQEQAFYLEACAHRDWLISNTDGPMANSKATHFNLGKCRFGPDVWGVGKGCLRRETVLPDHFHWLCWD